MKGQQTNLPSAPETDTSCVFQGYLLTSIFGNITAKWTLCDSAHKMCRNLKDSWVTDSQNSVTDLQNLLPLIYGLSSYSAHVFWDTLNRHDLPGPIKSKWCDNVISQEIFRTLMSFVLHTGIVDTGQCILDTSRGKMKCDPGFQNQYGYEYEIR